MCRPNRKTRKDERRLLTAATFILQKSVRKHRCINRNNAVFISILSFPQGGNSVETTGSPTKAFGDDRSMSLTVFLVEIIHIIWTCMPFNMIIFFPVAMLWRDKIEKNINDFGTAFHARYLLPLLLDVKSSKEHKLNLIICHLLSSLQPFKPLQDIQTNLFLRNVFDPSECFFKTKLLWKM